MCVAIACSTNHVTRHIKRMNRQLHLLINESAAVKVGNRWSLSPFIRRNWGAKVDEVEEADEAEEREKACTL